MIPRISSGTAAAWRLLSVQPAVTRPGLDESDWQSEEIELVVRQIEHYLVEHPDARDTLHGVRDWWLESLGRALRLEVVQAALDRLVAGRAIESRSIPGGVVYGRVKREEGE